jgi:cellulose synthase/poly-beta-1,6-N-acetylglucosamine synthase-like glycosyltransferase
MGESDGGWRPPRHGADTNAPHRGHFSETSHRFITPSAHYIGYDLPVDVGFLAGNVVAEDTLCRIAAIARRKGLEASEVLIARQVMTRDQYLAELARYIGADFEPLAPPAEELLVPNSIESGALAMWSLPENAYVMRNGKRHLLLAPRGNKVVALLNALGGHCPTHRSITIVPPKSLRFRLFERLQRFVLRQAIDHLSDKYSHFSARQRLTIAQWLGAGALAMVLLFALLLAPKATILVACCMLSLCFCCSILLRCRLIARLDGLGRQPEIEHRAEPEDWPTYSVLVPLYREESQIRDLLASLRALKWPGEKLEIFLICEGDDAATIAAVRAADMPAGGRLIVCPRSEPRTKPKALNFALPLCAGEFLVIYDAEDRPSPNQLLQAWTLFRRGSDRLACLQAPLLTHNRTNGWLASMFAIEYDTLFLGTLPALEGLTSVFPLGGTSNHFRTAALRAVGCWDPFNVTEDADLGIRLARNGFHTGVISLPTIEEAPERFQIWFGQRKRWLKGWMQTLLVHMRDPKRTCTDLGWRNFFYLQLLLTCQVLSTLSHPFFIAIAGYQIFALLQGEPYTPFGLAILGISIFNLVGGYSSYGFLAMAVRIHAKRSSPSAWLLLTFPAYWLCMSLACWGAVWQLIRAPFHWEKTEHGLAKSCDSANIVKGRS